MNIRPIVAGTLLALILIPSANAASSFNGSAIAGSSSVQPAKATSTNISPANGASSRNFLGSSHSGTRCVDGFEDQGSLECKQ